MLAWTIALVSNPTLAFGGWTETFTDPSDGWFDASKYLLERKGALPAPIVITEPAVGYGGGAALVFFQQSLGELKAQAQGQARYRPPNVYAVAGFGTENGSWGTGGGGMVSFARDRWRWRGGGAYCHLNLNFYGLDAASGSSGGVLNGSGAGYSLEGYGVASNLLYRLGSSKVWTTARVQYLSLESSFDIDLAPFPNQTRRSSGLGPSIEYDSRDNLFTPNRGWTGTLAGMFYDPAWGSDATFQIWRGHAIAYTHLPRRLILGVRFDGRSASGDTPFYMLPYVDLRGIPALRYQGENTAVLEGELRWNVTPRWALVGFGGGGRAWGPQTSFEDTETRESGGTGFRYHLARQLGLYGGLDFAWGPEFALYLQIGNAWL